MTLHALRLFTEISKDLNLGTTARRLYISQQALSGTIKRLEEHYGVKLFERSPKFELTREGKELLASAEKMIVIEDDLLESFGMSKSENNGVLRIATSMARSRAYMPQVISEFNFRYPAVSIHLLDEHNLRNQEPLSSGDIDIIIGGHGPESFPGIKSEILLPDVEGYIILTDTLLRKYLKGKTDKFIEARGGRASVTDFPKDIPISLIGNSSKGTWLLDRIPAISEHPCSFIPPENDDLLIKHCLEGKGMVFMSKLYMDIIAERYPSELEKLHMFIHMENNKPMLIQESLVYDSSKKHPKYFYDFIEIAKNVTSKMKDQDSL